MAWGDLSEELRERIRRENEEYDRQDRQEDEEWVNQHAQRTPVYPRTGETGTFAGVFCRLAPGFQVVCFPYYRTPSGTTFYEWDPQPWGNPRLEAGQSLRFDIERWKRSDTIRFYTAEGWVQGEPVPWGEAP